MNDNELDIIIRLLLDQASKQKLDAGVKESAKNIEGLGDSFSADDMNADFAKFQQAFDKTFKRVGENLVNTRTGLKATAGELKRFSSTSSEELDRIIKSSGKAVVANKELEKSAARAAAAQAAMFSAQANLLTNQVSQIRARASQLDRISSSLGGASRTGLALGIGVVGSIFAGAQKYVDNAKEATAVTIAWKRAQDDLAKSGEKIGAVFAQAALPLLKQAAEAARQAAGFIESHPEVVQAALNTGLIVAGLSAVGIMVSKGIKLYADYLYLSSVPIQLQAARLQAEAAKSQLAAAVLQARAKGLGVAGTAATSVAAGGGLTGTLTGLGLLSTAGGITLLGTTIAVGLGGIIGVGINDLITKVTGKGAFTNQFLTVGAQSLGNNVLGPLAQRVWGDSPEEAQRKTLIFTALVGKFTGAIDENSPLWLRAAAVVKKSTGEMNEALSGLQASPNFEKILEAYEKYQADDVKLVQDHYADRQKVIADSLADEQRSNAQFAASAGKIRTQAAKGIRDATASFQQDNQRAEVDNARDRAEIIRDGGQDIQRIEKDLQEKLRKLALDHSDRMDNLARDRDALGLVKEARAYNRERGEEIRATNIEVRQRRADIAQRLADLQVQYEQERARRLEDFQIRVNEIKAQAAQQMAELRIQHAAELQEIRANRIARLREIDQQFADERRRRVQQLVQTIKDLDASLIGESNLRKQYQARMITDLETFLRTYQTKLATLGAKTATKAAGGYASYGTYLLGDQAGGGRGKPEFVLSGNTTAMAERMIGGNLSQDNLLAALGMMGSARQAGVNYTDNRRMDSRISPIERKKLVDETVNALSGLFSRGMSQRAF